jgi:6-phosphogluconolactonase (cycloisomerase 2 family)
MTEGLLMKVSRNLKGWGLALLAITAVGVLVATVGQTPVAGQRSGRAVLYASMGPELTIYDLDVDKVALTKRETMKLPGFVTEAALHPSRRFLYIVWGGFPGGGEHGMSAFRIDPATGALTPHGPSVSLRSTPGYISAVVTDVPATHILASDSEPSRISVHKLLPDGTIAEEVFSAGKLDFGIHAHQIRMDPSGQTVVLPCRGESADATRVELPGSLRLFGYKDGILTEKQAIMPGGGFNFQPRHMDFHPSGKWDYFTLERQNKMLVYERMKDGSLGKQLYAKDTLSEPGNVRPGQIAGTVHVHPNGKFVYLANRASGTTMVDGKRVFVGGENAIAVFSIDQKTGEPTLIQNMDTRGIHPRTFALDPTSRILVAANTNSLPTQEGIVIPASLSAYRIGADGKLEFVRKYDVALNGSQQFWMGIIPLP